MPNALAKCWDSALPVHGWMRGEAVGQPRILGLYNLRESRTRAAEYRSSARGARAGAVRSVARVAVVMSTGQAAGCARFLPAAANDLAVLLFCRHAFCALDVASLLRCQTTALHARQLRLCRASVGVGSLTRRPHRLRYPMKVHAEMSASALSYARAEAVLGYGPMLARVGHPRSTRRLESRAANRRVCAVNDMLASHSWLARPLTPLECPVSNKTTKAGHSGRPATTTTLKPRKLPPIGLQVLRGKPHGCHALPASRVHTAISLDDALFGSVEDLLDVRADFSALKASRSQPHMLRTRPLKITSRQQTLHMRMLQERIMAGRLAAGLEKGRSLASQSRTSTARAHPRSPSPSGMKSELSSILLSRDAAQVFFEADVDGDSMLSFEEFLQVVRPVATLAQCMRPPIAMHPVQTLSSRHAFKSWLLYSDSFQCHSLIRVHCVYALCICIVCIVCIVYIVYALYAL